MLDPGVIQERIPTLRHGSPIVRRPWPIIDAVRPRELGVLAVIHQQHVAVPRIAAQNGHAAELLRIIRELSFWIDHERVIAAQALQNNVQVAGHVGRISVDSHHHLVRQAVVGKILEAYRDRVVGLAALDHHRRAADDGALDIQISQRQQRIAVVIRRNDGPVAGNERIGHDPRSVKRAGQRVAGDFALGVDRQVLDAAQRVERVLIDDVEQRAVRPRSGEDQIVVVRSRGEDHRVVIDTRRRAPDQGQVDVPRSGGRVRRIRIGNRYRNRIAAALGIDRQGRRIHEQDVRAAVDGDRKVVDAVQPGLVVLIPSDDCDRVVAVGAVDERAQRRTDRQRFDVVETDRLVPTDHHTAFVTFRPRVHGADADPGDVQHVARRGADRIAAIDEDRNRTGRDVERVVAIVAQHAERFDVAQREVHRQQGADLHYRRGDRRVDRDRLAVGRAVDLERIPVVHVEVVDQERLRRQDVDHRRIAGNDRGVPDRGRRDVVSGPCVNSVDRNAGVPVIGVDLLDAPHVDIRQPGARGVNIRVADPPKRQHVHVVATQPHAVRAVPALHNTVPG